MNLIAWLVGGAAVGLLAFSLLKDAAGRPRLWLDVVAGAAGAWIGGSLFGPLISGAAVEPQGFGVTTFAVSIVGAVVLLIVARMLRRAASQ